MSKVHAMARQEVYNYACDFLDPAIDWLDEGYHLRDSLGRAITKLDQLLIAIEDGYWPIGVKTDEKM